ncbi:MAG: SPOR domain-containing protein [Candidatus Omnitrophica bacterium]|nr:SPOR domain-containing protein [Candidatus Omnitrophota bacterium]
MLSAISFQLSAETSTLANVEKLFMEGKYERAASEAEKLIDTRSYNREELYYLRGLSLLKLNRFPEARRSLEALVSKFPNGKRAFEAHVGIGDSYFLEGNVNEALKTYNGIVAGFPDDRNISIVYYRLSNCFKEMGLYDRSKEYQDKVKIASPLSFEAAMVRSSVSIVSPAKRTSARTNFLPKNTDSDSYSGSIETVKERDNGHFSVQVGSFKSRSNAEKFTRRLSSEGYDSRTELPHGSGDNYYRVKIGNYGTKAEAEAMASRLKKSGYKTKICQ